MSSQCWIVVQRGSGAVVGGPFFDYGKLHQHLDSLGVSNVDNAEIRRQLQVRRYVLGEVRNA